VLRKPIPQRRVLTARPPVHAQRAPGEGDCGAGAYIALKLFYCKDKGATRFPEGFSPKTPPATWYNSGWGDQ